MIFRKKTQYVIMSVKQAENIIRFELVFANTSINEKVLLFLKS